MFYIHVKQLLRNRPKGRLNLILSNYLNRHHLPYKGSALPLSDVSIFLKFEVVDVNGIVIYIPVNNRFATARLGVQLLLLQSCEPPYPVCKTGADRHGWRK